MMRRKYNGLYAGREYRSYRSMLGRCYNPNLKEYPRYGGRGITVCDRWRESFQNFFDDMGHRPENTTLDRIDNSKSYYKENCRWAGIREQANNTRRNKYHEYKGERLTASQIARRTGFSEKVMNSRLNRENWSIEKATTQPVQKQSHSKVKITKYHEYGGEMLTASQIAKKVGIPPHIMNRRLNERNWSVEKAANQPVRKVLSNN